MTTHFSCSTSCKVPELGTVWKSKDAKDEYRWVVTDCDCVLVTCKTCSLNGRKTMFVSTRCFLDEYEMEKPGYTVSKRKCDLDGCYVCQRLGHSRTKCQIFIQDLADWAECMLFFLFLSVPIMILLGMWVSSQ